MNYYLINAFKNLGKDQKEIIEDLKKSQPYVSALMNGRKKVGKGIAKELSRLYGFDEGAILTGEMLNDIDTGKTNEPSAIYQQETTIESIIAQQIAAQMDVLQKQHDAKLEAVVKKLEKKEADNAILLANHLMDFEAYKNEQEEIRLNENKKLG